jgi:hypothetical protein
MRILEQHKVLAQHADCLHRPNGHARVEHRIELVHQGHGLPVAAHQCSAGRARTDAGDQFILFGSHDGISFLKTIYAKLGSTPKRKGGKDEYPPSECEAESRVTPAIGPVVRRCGRPGPGDGCGPVGAAGLPEGPDRFILTA